MRTDKELFQVMLDRIDMFKTGLCGLACDLHDVGIITLDERRHIIQYVNNYKHTHLKYMFRRNAFMWTMRVVEPRIKWLKQQINKKP